jgi:hypothetical protein
VKDWREREVRRHKRGVHGMAEAHVEYVADEDIGISNNSQT